MFIPDICFATRSLFSSITGMKVFSDPKEAMTFLEVLESQVGSIQLLACAQQISKLDRRSRAELLKTQYFVFIDYFILV